MQWREGLAASALAIGVLLVGFVPLQSDFSIIFGGFAIAFGAYVWIVLSATKQEKWQIWLWLAILLRIALVFAFPNLSDDIYRFLWDGHLWLAGENPFNHLPSWYAAQGEWLPGHSMDLYKALNSPEYYTCLLYTSPSTRD